MKTTPKNRKPFDCVAFKRTAQERIYRRIQGLSHADELAYFDRAVESGPLAEFWRKVSKGGDESPDATTGDEQRP